MVSGSVALSMILPPLPSSSACWPIHRGLQYRCHRRGFNREHIPSHRHATATARQRKAWGKSAMSAILQNPRYTSREVLNRQRRTEEPLDVDDVAVGYRSKEVKQAGPVDLVGRANARAPPLLRALLRRAASLSTVRPCESRASSAPTACRASSTAASADAGSAPSSPGPPASIRAESFASAT